MLNYDQMYDELEKTQKLLVNEIKKINQKNDISPGELNSIKDAVCVMKDIINLDEMIESIWNDNGEDDYQGSYARGRSPRTGRYVSRMRGMSGHSLHDRMAANLESMMDSAGSDYERQQIGKWIDKIKNAPEV